MRNESLDPQLCHMSLEEDMHAVGEWTVQLTSYWEHSIYTYTYGELDSIVCWVLKSEDAHILHSKLRSIILVATKVHVILRSFVVLTWKRAYIELV